MTPTATTTTEDDMPRLLLAADGAGWVATDRGIEPVSMLEAQAIHRVLTATEYDPGSTTLDKIDPAQLTRYADVMGRLNPPVTSATATATIDPAVLKAAIDAALADVSFTTRKAIA